MTDQPFEDFAIPRRVPTGDIAWKLPIRIPVPEEDLADAGLLGPPGPSLIQRWLGTRQQRTAAELAAEREARTAAAEQAQTAAVAEWETLRAKLTDTPQGAALRALLDVHKPELYTYSQRGPVCGYCDQIGGPEREGVDWPCVNYEIVRDGMG
ncbi:MAG TPA: hypothetical protein VFU74_21885 [Actinocrinis sp.]|nr:hypothetical protein [Actinocrinis sp.]